MSVPLAGTMRLLGKLKTMLEAAPMVTVIGASAVTSPVVNWALKVAVPVDVLLAFAV